MGRTTVPVLSTLTALFNHVPVIPADACFPLGLNLDRFLPSHSSIALHFSLLLPRWARESESVCYLTCQRVTGLQILFESLNDHIAETAFLTIPCL